MSTGHTDSLVESFDADLVKVAADGGAPSNGLLSSVPSDLSDVLTTVRRHLHMNPEVGFQEFETSRYIRDVLAMYGLTFTGPIAHTGLYCDIEGSSPGPTVAYRADMDALPTQDLKETPYRSRVDCVGHLCGHDAHTAIALGVAILASRLREHLHGTLRVIFQPNEEGLPSGAPLMIRENVLAGVSAIYASHVDPTLPVGRYGLIAGAATASADRFRIQVKGTTTGHSARPHQSRDTVWIATHIANTLYQLVGRINDARNTAVLTICRFHGGEAYNVIPAEVEFGGTLRCIDTHDRVLLRERISAAARDIGTLHDIAVDVEFEVGAPPVVNDHTLVKVVAETIEEMFGEEAVYRVPRPSMGAEDFSYYLERVPGALVRVGTSSGPSTSHPLHDALFDVDEGSLLPASQLMVAVLINHLRKSVIAAASA